MSAETLGTLLAEAMRAVTRTSLFPGDRGYEKWLAKTVAAFLATPAGRKLALRDTVVEAAVAWHAAGDFYSSGNHEQSDALHDAVDVAALGKPAEKSSTWHHSPDAPTGHFCADCDALLARIKALEALRRALEDLAATHITSVAAHWNVDPECYICRAIAPLITLVASEGAALVPAEPPEADAPQQPVKP